MGRPIYVCTTCSERARPFDPRVRSYHGSITKRGSKYLRWIKLECLHAHIRNQKDSNVAQFYHRISKKKGNSKAAVAAASKLLKIVYWIMKEKGMYNRP
jgi:transposase